MNYFRNLPQKELLRLDINLTIAIDRGTKIFFIFSQYFHKIFAQLPFMPFFFGTNFRDIHCCLGVQIIELFLDGTKTLAFSFISLSDYIRLQNAIYNSLYPIHPLCFTSILIALIAYQCQFPSSALMRFLNRYQYGGITALQRAMVMKFSAL